MEDSPEKVIAIVIGAIIIIVGHWLYNRNPRLHRCASCGKYLSYKADRYWYKVDGKSVPVCSSCEERGPFTETPEVLTDDEKAKYILIGKLSEALTPEELEQVEISVETGRVSVNTKNKEIACKVSALLNADIQEKVVK